MTRKLQLATDRRREARLHLEAEAEIEVIDTPGIEPPETARIRGRTSNISQYGLRVAVLAHVELPEGSRVKVKLKPGYKTYALDGTVQWVWYESSAGSFAMGIDLSESSQRTLKRWRKFLVREFGEERLKATQ